MSETEKTKWEKLICGRRNYHSKLKKAKQSKSKI